MKMYIAWSLQRYPGLTKDFQDRPHPMLSAQAVIDEHNETQAMEPVTQAFRALGMSDNYFVSPCHDGLDFPSQGRAHRDLLEVARRSPCFRFAIKPDHDAIEFARQKHPDEDWSVVSVIPATLFLESCTKARRLGERNYRENSLVYRNIVEGRIYSRSPSEWRGRILRWQYVAAAELIACTCTS